MTLEEAADDLREKYKDDPNYRTTGVDDRHGLIYLYTKRKTKGYPTEHQGYEVRVRRMGVIRPMGG
jgi:hypothetical protein